MREREEQNQATNDRNAEEEADQRAELQSIMEHGTLWEQVARLVDLTPQAEETYNRKRDLSRMRNLLFQLKNQ